MPRPHKLAKPNFRKRAKIEKDPDYLSIRINAQLTLSNFQEIMRLIIWTI
jgi:hypothetical protein